VPESRGGTQIDSPTQFAKGSSSCDGEKSAAESVCTFDGFTHVAVAADVKDLFATVVI